MVQQRDKLIELRKNKGWSQIDLAEKAGISRTYLVHLEKGRYTPSLPVSKRIASVLGAPIEEIF